MKKKIAVFANGWSNEYLELVLEGVRRRIGEENIDLFIFVNFSVGDEEEIKNILEMSIFKLPDINDFDGVILLANTINLPSERKYLQEEIMKYNKPAVCLEYEMKDIPYLGTDTYQGVYDLIIHVLEKHNAQEFLFYSGPIDNLESQTRRKAVEDALETAGLVLREEQVLYANWSYYTAYEITKKWVQEHDRLPDAIVCANDEMALAVCTTLDSMGIRTPEDVIVTGCDCIQKGQEFYPILSTVGRGWERLGDQAMDYLLQKMAGEKIEPKTILHSNAVLGESCGCCVSRSKLKERLHSINQIYRLGKQNITDGWYLNYLDSVISKTSTDQEMKTVMGGHYQNEHSYEGSDFMICMVDDYLKNLDGDEIGSRKMFTEYMEVCTRIKNGRACETERFLAKKLMPNYEEDNTAHMYVFVTLHEQNECIGYIMQKDHTALLYNQEIYLWKERIGRDLKRVRQNVHLEELNKKLREISITDALTGLRNRNGFEVLALPYLQKCQQEGRNSAIVFADINHMKTINDQYGHLQGDLALCTVAEAIKRSLPQDWIAVRYGGDEFIMVGDCEDMHEAELIRQKLEKELNELKEKRQLVFQLSASLGAVVMHPKEKYSLEEYLRKADEAMYEAKQKYHSLKDGQN